MSTENERRAVHVVQECTYCGEEFCMGECTWEHPDNEPEDCSCRFCLCMNQTEYGEVCADCRAGAHQG